MTASERLKIVEDFASSIRQKYPQTDQYNVLVFGSFLTERYTAESDIDIGIFSLIPGLTFRLYSFTKDNFDKLGIDSDVVRMKLSDSQYINISIVTGQQYAVTDYCPEILIDYTKKMIVRYGNNPQEVIVKQMHQEVRA
ncbi:nucleotidyltransferase family protein [Clostridium sp. Marseille-P2415]|uniref:nucleotidyltransferase family protein n=1 Tax=Clostridium sp. Marseille-P2415 TaxID=1805471 RepID=UPI0009883F8E|nr:nucleotidyltransferase domain-containing protein [Clostridium sp. Marseille-P2415]